MTQYKAGDTVTPYSDDDYDMSDEPLPEPTEH